MTPAEHHVDHVARVIAALASNRAAVRQANPFAWQLQTTVIERVIEARVADEWLLLETSLDEIPRRSNPGNSQDLVLPVQLLRWNATLPGGAKFAMDAQFNLSLRVEAALLEDTDPGPRLLEGWNGIEAGLARFYGDPERPPTPARASATGTPLDLKTLAGETAWTFTERQDGSLAFELPSDEAGGAVVLVRETGSGGVRAWMPCASVEELHESSQHALAILLLRAGAVLRLARPAFVPDDAQTSACLEVQFDSVPVPAELTQAIESLAVGSTLAAREATLLCEEQAARDYLAAGTWIPREQGDNNNNQQPQ